MSASVQQQQQQGGSSNTSNESLTSKISKMIGGLTGGQNSGDKKTISPISVRQHPDYDENTKMMACEWRGTENVQIAERAKPKSCEPHDAVIRVTSTTICGSDLHLYYNQLQSGALRSGDILGHECMGVVESIGSEVKDLQIGDRVVVSAVISCGMCTYCKEGRMSQCDTTNPSQAMEQLYGHRTSGLFGYSHLTGGYDGGQSEYVWVPFAELNCLRVPNHLADDKVLFLSDVVCTAWHANELARVETGKTVVIWGCGPVGLMAAHLARFRQAGRVIVIDNVQYRLEMAKKYADAEIIDFDNTNVLDELKRIIPNGPDCCIDCAGYRFPKTTLQAVMRKLSLQTDAVDIVDEMVRAAKKGGQLALIGDYFAYTNQFPIGAFMEKGLNMSGGQVFVQKYWSHLLGLIEQGAIDPTFLITHRMALKDIAQAYDIFAHQKDRVQKIVLRTPYGLEQERLHGSEQQGQEQVQVQSTSGAGTTLGSSNIGNSVAGSTI